MRDFILLIKMNIIQILNSFKEKKNKKLSLGVTYFIIAVLFIFISFYYNYEIHRVLKIIGDLDKYLGVSSSVALIFIMVTSITKVKGSFYGNKDYNLLKTMPIKKSAIISYKIFMVYVTELAFAMLFIIPNVIFTIYYGEITSLYMLTSLANILFTPLLPILLFGIIGLFLSLVFDKFKYSSIITSLLMIGFIVGIYAMIYIPSEDQLGNMYVSLYNGLSKINPLMRMLKEASCGDAKSLVIFVSFNVIFALFTIILFSTTYNYINMKIDSRTYRKTKNVEYKSGTVNKALFKTELRRIMTSHNILINVLMGPIMSVFVIVIMYFSLQQDKNIINEVKNVLPIISVMIIGICPYTSFSISAEGEQFWILKVIPVSTKTIFKNKIFVSCIFSIPFAIIAAIVTYFIFKVNLIIMTLLAITFVLADILAIYFGLYQNLKKGQIHYKNELEAIKKGSSTLIMLGIFTLLYIIYEIILVVTKIFLSVYLGYAAIILIQIILIFVAINLLNKNGQKLFDAIY